MALNLLTTEFSHSNRFNTGTIDLVPKGNRPMALPMANHPLYQRIQYNTIQYNKVISIALLQTNCCFTALYIKVIKESIVDHGQRGEFWDIFGRHPAKDTNLSVCTFCMTAQIPKDCLRQTKHVLFCKSDSSVTSCRRSNLFNLTGRQHEGWIIVYADKQVAS